MFSLRLGLYTLACNYVPSVRRCVITAYSSSFSITFELGFASILAAGGLPGTSPGAHKAQSWSLMAAYARGTEQPPSPICRAASSACQSPSLPTAVSESSAARENVPRQHISPVPHPYYRDNPVISTNTMNLDGERIPMRQQEQRFSSLWRRPPPGGSGQAGVPPPAWHQLALCTACEPESAPGPRGAQGQPPGRPESRGPRGHPPSDSASRGGSQPRAGGDAEVYKHSR